MACFLLGPSPVEVWGVSCDASALRDLSTDWPIYAENESEEEGVAASGGSSVVLKDTENGHTRDLE